MASTARAAMPYPALTDTPDVPRDVKALADRVDAVTGLVSCTSAARPASPFVGMVAYETDTKNTIRWSGSAWVVTSPSAPGRFHWGVATANTDASSEITITHGAPFTPTVVIPINGAASSDQIVSVHTLAATTFKTVWRSSAGATLGSGLARTVAYLCLE